MLFQTAIKPKTIGSPFEKRKRELLQIIVPVLLCEITVTYTMICLFNENFFFSKSNIEFKRQIKKMTEYKIR